MEHQKIAVESSNEVKKMEIDKKRDDLSKKTDQHARMKEAAKREHENQMAHQKLDNAKQLDKTKLTQQGEIDALNGREISDKTSNGSVLAPGQVSFLIPIEELTFYLLRYS